MGNNKQVTAIIYGNAIHNEQVLCAARLWAERNNCSFEIRCEKNTDPYYITAVKILVDGLSILIDNSDSPVLLDVHDKIDAYYKRSFINENVNQEFPYPILPFGFNYGVTYKPFSWKRVTAFKQDKVFLARSLPVVNRLVNLSYRHIDYRKMYATPRDNGGNMLYLTRLWNPGNVSSQEKKIFRQHLNEVRIGTVRKLKKQFGNRLTTGIEDTPLAREVCPELIIPSKISAKKNYLKLLLNADICIATNGLENTLGWRIGEYVAFSKAVVTEPFNVVVPGWEEGAHYYSFDDTNLADKIEALLYNKTYLQMQQHNHAYYNNYLEPEALFARLLSGVKDRR